MLVIKCDLCKKEAGENPIVAGFGHWPKYHLCEECGLPILKYLRKIKFLDKNNKEIEKS